MKEPLTKELMIFLEKEGYTYLVAENQARNENYVFYPVDWPVEQFQDDTMFASYEDHMIVYIPEALSYWNAEDYMYHQIIMPEY